MRSFQTKLLSEFEAIAITCGLEPVIETEWPNVGRILAQDGFKTVARLNFKFDRKTMILFNGAEHGPPGPDNYWFDSTDATRITDALNRWIVLCGGK